MRGQFVLLRPAAAIGGIARIRRSRRAAAVARDGSRVGRHRQPQPADQVAAAVRLLEHEGQPRAAVGPDRLLELEDRLVRLADLGIDAPGRRRVAVDRHRGRPALLVEVGGGVPEGDRHGGRARVDRGRWP